MQVQFFKRDTLIWRSWGAIPFSAFDTGVIMTLPSGRTVKFLPCKSTKTPALKPIPSVGYGEWCMMPNQTEILATIEPIGEIGQALMAAASK